MRLIVGSIVMVALAVSAWATNVGVTGKKLIVLDKLAVGTAKVMYVSKDRTSGISKGTGTDVTDVTATFELAYGNGSVAGAFAIPSGASDGTAGWVVNKDTVAKYVNKQAPDGPTEAKLAVVKSGTLLKVVGKGLGDEPIDLLAGGDPELDGIRTAYCITNAGDERCHCTHFTGCAFSPVAGGTGAKLVCRAGAGDPACAAHATTTTSTTTSTTDTSSTSTTSTTSTSTTLQVVGASACCQGAGECIDAPGFSLYFYLLQYCSFLPGSTPVPGGACSLEGDCEIATIPPTSLCCQVEGSCFDGPADDSGDIWWFRNQCVGAYQGTAYGDAVCGPDDACVAQ